jgi:hypothetical protein
MGSDEVLEQGMGDLDVFAELLPPFLGVLTEHRERAFVLAGRDQLVVHIMALE